MAIKLEEFSFGADVLSIIAQGIDLYTSAKFGAFNTNLNNSACFLQHFSVLQERTYHPHFFQTWQNLIVMNSILVSRVSWRTEQEDQYALATNSGDIGFKVLEFRTSGHFRFKSKLEDSLLKALNPLHLQSLTILQEQVNAIRNVVENQK